MVVEHITLSLFALKSLNTSMLSITSDLLLSLRKLKQFANHALVYYAKVQFIRLPFDRHDSTDRLLEYD